MTKDLRLTVTLQGNQAQMALRGLISQLEQADKKQEELEKSSKKASGAVKDLGSSATQSSFGVKKLGDETEEAGKKGNRAFSAIGSLTKQTGSNILQATKYAAGLGTAFATVATKMAVGSYIEFDRNFSLMNSTLQAQSKETLNYMFGSLKELSNKTGMEINELVSATTTMLSSGFKPTAPEGTAEYMKQLEELTVIQDKLTTSALGMGEGLGEVSTAYSYMSSGLGLDKNSMETANYVADLMAATLDRGQGTLSEYLDQFVKITNPGKLAGFTDNEIYAVFAEMTNKTDPNQAGFVTKALFEGMNNLTKQAPYAANAVKKAMETATESEKAVLEKFNSVEEWQGFMFSDRFDEEGNRLKKSGKELLNDVNTLFSNLPEGTVLKDQLFGAYADDANTRKALYNLLGDKNFGQLEDTIKFFDEAEIGTGKLSGQKANIMMKSTAVSWSGLMNTIKNESLTFMNAMSPALNAFFLQAKGAITGQGFKSEDGMTMAQIFSSVRSELEKTYPAFVPILDGLESLANWIGDGRAKEALSDTLQVFEAIGKTFVFAIETATAFWDSAPMQWIRNITGDNPVINVMMAIGGYTAAKMALTALGTTVMTGIGASMGPVLGMTMAGAFGSALLASTAWVAIAGVLGVAVGKEIYEWTNKAKEEQVEKAKEVSASSQDIAMQSRNYTTAEQFDKSSKETAKNMEEKLIFSNITPAQSQMISEAVTRSLGRQATFDEKLDAIRKFRTGITSKEVVNLLGVQGAKQFGEVEQKSWNFKNSGVGGWAADVFVPGSNRRDYASGNALLDNITAIENLDKNFQEKFGDTANSMNTVSGNTSVMVTYLRDISNGIQNLKGGIPTTNSFVYTPQNATKYTSQGLGPIAPRNSLFVN